MNTPPPRSPLQAKTRAFTLVEILVVVAIIGVLAALAFPALRRAQSSSAAAKALSKFKQVAMANGQFGADNDGQILGWGRYNVWGDDTYLMRNLNLYLNGVNVSGNSNDAMRRIGKGLEPFVDPLVPKAYSKYTEYFPFTWGIDRIFNMANGRFYQYGRETAAWSGDRNPRRMVEFEQPSKTIWAVSGSFELNPTDLANADLVKEPVGRQRIFYYYNGGKSTPAIFLDGHAELLAFQIPVSQITPGATP
jgi:prepilin-type N-terminal cleavage/methylation domain-containing protein